MSPRIAIVVNADWFFVSHRMPLGRALLERGYDVTIIAGRSDAAETIERAGMRFIELPIERGGRNPAFEAVTASALLRVYRREAFDLVHHVTIKPVLYGSLAARAVGISRVVNAVSGLGFAFIRRPREGVRLRATRYALWTTYRQALRGEGTRIIFQNRDDRDLFISRGIVDPGRARLIIGSGVDVERFGPRAREAAPAPVVMLPARLLWDKGVGEFVGAARALRAQGVSARFALVGRLDPANPAGISRATLDQWCASGLVEWWGPKHAHEMPAVYAAASLVVLPSYREGMPLALAEAAATGRACVSTDVPGCREAVIAGSTGWLVPPRDEHSLASAIREALADPMELDRRGAAAREHAVRNLSLSGVLARTLAVYDELFDGAPVLAAGETASGR